MLPAIAALSASSLAFRSAAVAVPQASIPTVPLVNGVLFPMISLGTGGYNDSMASDAFTLAFGINFTAVDTALDYGNQLGLSGAIASSGIARDKIFVLSKVPGCGDTPILPQTEAGCYNATLNALRTDLSQLKLSRVDAMLLHSPPTGDVSGCSSAQACKLIQAQWKAMERFYNAGGTRSIGVSNYCESCLECVKKTATVKPMINQIQYHAGMGPGPTKALVTYCADEGVLVQAYSPLGGSSSVHPDDPYPLIHNAALVAIGKKYKKSAVQVALRWVLQQGLPLATKSDRHDYMVEDTDVWDFALSDAEMQQLADTSIDPDDPTRNACV